MQQGRINGLWAALFLVGAGFAQAQRVPQGVYAKVNVETAKSTSCSGAADVHTCMQKLYAKLLTNLAVSGLAVGLHWDKVSLSVPTAESIHSNDIIYDFDHYDWSDLNDVFGAVEAAVGKHTVQLIITPGFDTPQWVLSRLESCDGLFTGGTTSAGCGTVTFDHFPEQQHADGGVLPLPWNDSYQRHWLAFLQDIRDKFYDSKPEWVAIALTGPVGASDEMIFPTDENTPKRQIGGYTADKIWQGLLKNNFPGLSNTSYRDTDQAIIDHWNQVIDQYQAIFKGLTLVLSADAGNYLPNFNNSVTPSTGDVNLFGLDCSSAPSVEMSCEAKTEVLTHFIQAAGPNAKATQVGGLKASSPLDLGDIGLPGVKLLTANPPDPRLGNSAPPSPFLGGAEFDHPVSAKDKQVQLVGCPSKAETCTLNPVTAGYNVLANFFSETPYFGYFSKNLEDSPRPTNKHWATGSQLVQYLEVPFEDVLYAQKYLCPPLKDRNRLDLGTRSLQDLLNVSALFLTKHQLSPLPTQTCPIVMDDR